MNISSANRFHPLVIIWIFISICACNSNDDQQDLPNSTADLIIKIDVDPQQLRLGNNGSPSPLPAGNAGQDPNFKEISAHYLEFAPNAFTPLGHGEVLYHAPETVKGGETAIDFDKSIIIAPGKVFLKIALADIKPGTYEWVRLSLSYQNLEVQLNFEDMLYDVSIAGFVGFNTYISSFKVKEQVVEVNENKLQGFFAFESIVGVTTGQVPPGATTVPNPIFNTSPIPPGSCVVTGKFASPLRISGNETEDINLTMSLSTNKSFEWEDTNDNGKWDIGGGYNEKVVDMGLRGLIPKID